MGRYTTFFIVSFLACMAFMSAASAQTPMSTPGASPVSADGGWQVADIRTLEVEGEGLALSPDGQWLAGVGPDSTPCFWDVETLTPQCADVQLPIMVHTFYPAMAWAPDSSAVVFSLDAIQRAYDSDIFLFERESGSLTNLTEDGFEGSIITDAPDRTPVDIVPTWSPDGRQIVFSRTEKSGEGWSTAIMRIDRSGGEPVEVVLLDVDEPFIVWMPMSWLPDDTILYSRSSSDLDDPENGIWRVGVDGRDPVKLVAGDAASDIPGAMVADVDPSNGTMSVYSPILLSQYASRWEQPIFWTGNIGDGAVTPLPLYDADQGVELPPSSVQSTEVFKNPLLSLPFSPAALSPDGATAFAIYQTMNGEASLATLDVSSGTITSLTPLPGDIALQPVTPQWVDSGTILLWGAEGWLLVTMEQAG